VWYVCEISVRPDAAEAAGSRLFDLGSNGIVTLAETNDQTRLAAYFNAVSRAELRRRIEKSLAAGVSIEFYDLAVSAVPPQDWMRSWKEGFEPVRIGRRLVISPSWRLDDVPVGAVVVRIDPGMAFGTGTHETTRMCLELLEAHWNGETLLDVGTGTGIIAITAAKLRPTSRVLAIDIDPVAVSIADENVELNQVRDNVEVIEASPRTLDGRSFDFVVANLTAESIIELAGDLSRCVTAGGLLAVSGVLTEHASRVASALADNAFALIEQRELGEWIALLATCY
jgi:ribosomal protein L11 methyltransferase